MQNEDRYDELISKTVAGHFPECDWLLVKAQIAQESAFDPNAKSPCGALGLMQLMPSTASSLFGVSEKGLLEPAVNIACGVEYLRIQYERFPEIPGHEEKLKFALASYNGGRGYANKAIELAYRAEHGVDMPRGHRGAKAGAWQTWMYAKEYLKSPACTVAGKTPDWRQMTDYVGRIWEKYDGYKRG